VEAVLSHKAAAGGGLPPLVHVHPGETLRSAIAVLREYGVSQMPVVKAEPPLSLAEVVGTVTDRGLLARLVADPGAVDTLVGSVMDPPLPMIGSGEPVDVAAARLADGAAVLVIDGGHPTGILTRSDVLEFLSGPRPGGGGR
jgi:cystathionine beta-synthase